MPLNWVWSSFLLFLILLSGCLVYSVENLINCDSKSMSDCVSVKNLWSW